MGKDYSFIGKALLNWEKCSLVRTERIIIPAFRVIFMQYLSTKPWIGSWGLSFQECIPREFTACGNWFRLAPFPCSEQWHVTKIQFLEPLSQIQISSMLYVTPERRRGKQKNPMHKLEFVSSCPCCPTNAWSRAQPWPMPKGPGGKIPCLELSPNPSLWELSSDLRNSFQLGFHCW